MLTLNDLSCDNIGIYRKLYSLIRLGKLIPQKWGCHNIFPEKSKKTVEKWLKDNNGKKLYNYTILDLSE